MLTANTTFRLQMIFAAIVGVILLHLITYDLGMGQDECAITLTGLKNIEWGLAPDYQLRKALAAMLGYSRGALSIAWDSLVLGIASALGIPLSTFVTNLPSTLPIFGAAACLFAIGRRLNKDPFVNLTVAGLFLLSPGIVGYMRTLPLHASLTIGLKALLVYFAVKEPTRLRIGPYVALAALIHTDNGALFSFLQIFGFTFCVRFFRQPSYDLSSAYRVIKTLVFTPFILFPAISGLALIGIYLRPIGSGGIIAHNLSNIKMGFFFDFSYLLSIAVQCGWGLVGFFVWVLLGSRLRKSESLPETLSFAFLLISSFVFVCLRNWGDAQNYVPFLVFPLSGLTLSLSSNDKSTSVSSFCAVVVSGIFCLYHLHGPIPSKPRFYGEIALHRQINWIKAAGYILREQGLNPLEQRKIAPHLRTVTIVDGEPPQDKPFFAAIYYFGTAPRNTINPTTQVIYESDHIYWKPEVRAKLGQPDKFKHMGFGLTHRLQWESIDVAWLFERCLPACSPTKIHDVKLLAEAWDQKYATRSQIMTVDWTVP
jgi:hypothetical protein